MIHKIKALGLVLAAVMALSGLAASGAQAQAELHIRSENDTTITAETITQHVRRVGTAETRCQEVTFEGRIPGSRSGGGQTRVTDVLLTPTFGNCQWLSQEATIQMNGCKFTLSGSASALRFQFKVTGCTAGKKIVEVMNGCQMEIGEQAELDHVVFSNRENAPRLEDVDENTTVSGITIVKTGLFCPSGTQMSLSGETTIQAYEDLGDEQVTDMGHQFSRSQCGNEVGILVT